MLEFDLSVMVCSFREKRGLIIVPSKEATSSKDEESILPQFSLSAASVLEEQGRDEHGWMTI